MDGQLEDDDILCTPPTLSQMASHHTVPNGIPPQAAARPAGRPAEAANNGRAVSHGKWFNDPVHGLFRLDPVCIAIMDSPQFQRLRELKQLGLTYYVFPGASHNRFEHSLGVAHLAGHMALHIFQIQGHELGMTSQDRLMVEVAGLCHDLGHGPFSHVFDGHFLPRSGISNWSHEEMSVQIFRDIVDDGFVRDDELSDDQVNMVGRLITASHASTSGRGSQNESQYLFDIVANGRNGIDVDKFDYLVRDALYCGAKTSCDISRLMKLTKVIDDEICFKWSEYNSLSELYHTRATMHRTVYTHRKAKALEYMVVDALLAADEVLKLSLKAQDSRKFVKLDDTLLKGIENMDLYNSRWLDDCQMGPIARAQHIIARLRRRDIYKYIREMMIPSEELDRGRWVMPSVEDIIGHYGGPVRLRGEDIILSEAKIDYTMKGENPLNHVHFFHQLEDAYKFPMKQEDVNAMLPSYFQEKKLRVYSRNSDPAYVRAVDEAFQSWLHRRFAGKVQVSTPARPLTCRARTAPPAKRQRRLTFQEEEEPFAADQLDLH